VVAPANGREAPVELREVELRYEIRALSKADGSGDDSYEYAASGLYEGVRRPGFAPIALPPRVGDGRRPTAADRTAVAVAYAAHSGVGLPRAASDAWERLLRRSVAAGSPPGVVTILTGGRPTLARELGVHEQALARCLERQRSITQTFHGPRQKRHAPLVGVHVPRLTELTLWLASAFRDSQVEGSLLVQHAAMAAEYGVLPPSKATASNLWARFTLDSTTYDRHRRLPTRIARCGWRCQPNLSAVSHNRVRPRCVEDEREALVG